MYAVFVKRFSSAKIMCLHFNKNQRQIILYIFATHGISLSLIFCKLLKFKVVFLYASYLWQ